MNYANSSTEISKIQTALIDAQYEMEGVHKGANNPFFKSKYADLVSVLGVIRPIWSKHGLGFMQFPSGDGNSAGVLTRVMHKSGEWIEYEFQLPLAKKDPQAAGSAITYARRYSLMAIAGLPAIDDDAETAMLRVKPKVNTDQIAVIADLLSHSGMSESEFSQKVRIKNLADLDAERFDGAVKYLTELATDVAESNQEQTNE